MKTEPGLEGFTDLLDRHGGDPARWPPSAGGAAAAALLEQSTAARALLARQQDLEAWLRADAAALPGPSARLRAAILAAAPAAPHRSLWQELWQVLGGIRIAGPAFATALLLGLALGGMGQGELPGDGGDDADLVTLAQLDDDYLAY